MDFVLVVVFRYGGFDFGCLCGGFGVFDGGLWGDRRWWLVRWDVGRWVFYFVFLYIVGFF